MLISFLLTVMATAVLLVETRVIGSLAEMAADPASSGEHLRAMPSTLVHSVGGTEVLLVILVLNVYKPQGMTRHGWRRQQEQRASRDGADLVGRSSIPIGVHPHHGGRTPAECALLDDASMSVAKPPYDDSSLTPAESGD